MKYFVKKNRKIDNARETNSIKKLSRKMIDIEKNKQNNRQTDVDWWIGRGE